MDNTPLLSDDRNNVKRKIQHALLDGRVVIIEDKGFVHDFRFGERNVEIDDGDYTVVPIETGVFKRVLSSDEKPHWLFHGHVDEIGDFIMPIIDAMEPMDREAWYVGFTASIVLSDMCNERRPPKAPRKV